MSHATLDLAFRASVLASRGRKAAITLATLLAAISGSQAACAQVLVQLYRAAVAGDPPVGSARAQLRAADERVVQAKAGFAPVIGLTANRALNRYREEAPVVETRPFSSKQVNLQASIPVLRASQFATLDVAGAQRSAIEAQVAAAELEAAQRLVEGCVELFKAQDALYWIGAQRAAVQEQLNAAQSKLRAGAVPITDVREAEARFDAVGAQLTAVEYELDLRLQTLAELVGKQVSLKSRPREPLGIELPDLPRNAVNEWISAASSNNATFRQAQRTLDAARAEVRKAEYAHAPTADLSYTYSVVSETGSVTSAVPRRSDNGQLSLTVNVPLFAGGAVQSRVEEALALESKAQSDLDGARRNISLTVRQAYSAALSALGQAVGLQAAVRSNETALRAFQRGYDVGVRVSGDILDAQARLFDSQRDLSKARFDAWTNFVRLKVSAGQFGDADLAEIDRRMRISDRLVP